VLQHRIADVMAIAVIDGLEPVDVDQRNTQTGAFMLVPSELLIEDLEDVAAVGQAGENVGSGCQESRIMRLPQ
jgi:hypothetical protein